MGVLECAVSTTSASQGNATQGGSADWPMYGTTADSTESRLIQQCGPLLVANSVTQTVYLVSFARYAVSTLNAGGALLAERRR